MTNVIVTTRPSRLSFHIPRPLAHFLADYDPNSRDSDVSIDFPAELAIHQFNSKIYSLLPTSSKRRKCI